MDVSNDAEYLKFKDILESLYLEHTHGHTLDLVITRKMMVFVHHAFFVLSLIVPLFIATLTSTSLLFKN